MNFKKWLLEEDFGSISNYLYGGAPEADEWLDVTNNPAKLELFKKKLENAVKLGNKLINIDFESLKKIPIISPKSPSMPDDKPWINKTDN